MCVEHVRREYECVCECVEGVCKWVGLFVHKIIKTIQPTHSFHS